MLCEALRRPTSRFLFERQFIRHRYKLLLQASWRPVRVLLHRCLNVICSVKSSEGLQAGFHWDDNFTAHFVNSRHKGAERLRGWERHCRRVLWLWERHLEHMCALQGSQRPYKRRKILTSIYMPIMPKGDTSDVRGSQRHTEAVADVKAAGGARIDKSTTPQ